MPKNESGAASRFLNATLAELASPSGKPAPAQEAAPQQVSMLVGHVGRDVIILGDVPGSALRALFNNRESK